MKTKKSILLVEDDKVDQLTISRVFKEIKIINELVIANNGEEALEYLRTIKNQKPGIILLDLNMPRMNGLEFLTVVKKDSELKIIPVVVLTTSKQDSDRVASFNGSVAGYIIKPVEYGKFVEAIKTIDLYWSLSEFSGE